MRMRLLAALAALATLIVSAPSPVAASYYEDGVTFTTQIIRDDHQFRLHVKATENMGGERSLEVSLTSIGDPDALRQKQTWLYELAPEEFVRTEDGFRIAVGGPGRPLDVHLTIAKRETPCSSRQGLYITRDDGTDYRIETDNQVFGTVTELSECASAYSFSSGQVPGPPPCPVSGTAVYSPLTLSKARGSDVASFLYSTGEARSISGEQVSWALQVNGRVDSSSFYLSRRLHGRFAGSGYAWLAGIARFRPDEPLQKTDWHRCRGGREYRLVQRQGDVVGDLHIQVIGEANRAVAARDAYFQRAWVRPRT